MAKDLFHNEFKEALENDGWKITHDPFNIRISEAIKLQIDLAASSIIAAERASKKIAVEIKSFVSGSDISVFHTALGQYLNYRQALDERDPDRLVYLAMPVETYEDFGQLSFIQRSIESHQVRLVIYEPYQKEIVQWID